MLGLQHALQPVFTEAKQSTPEHYLVGPTDVLHTINHIHMAFGLFNEWKYTLYVVIHVWHSDFCSDTAGNKSFSKMNLLDLVWQQRRPLLHQGTVSTSPYWSTGK